MGKRYAAPPDLFAITENNYTRRTSRTCKIQFETSQVDEVQKLEAIRNTTDADVKGGWILKATCDDTNKEPYPPRTFYKKQIQQQHVG